MTFPTPWTVQQYRWEAGATDAHGNPTEGYQDPVDVKVYGWSMPAPEERGERVLIDLKLYAPALTVDSRDEFVVDDVRYEVEGPVQDFTHGPFGFAPGVVVNLRRVEG